ncbi:hypothetical protein CERSUDRAFT_74267 [Gelatoporia subvermispora B]|uniref:Uncharacterized protein n=1 Tax=Ceriporiopsis subvermispora (strain B) TaxID=914234 RepID=M2RCT7_CERS8|nr:hypothetical protein CERSUDRAFT_74267 [Gelatoporia subvermispora B]
MRPTAFLQELKRLAVKVFAPGTPDYSFAEARIRRHYELKKLENRGVEGAETKPTVKAAAAETTKPVISLSSSPTRTANTLLRTACTGMTPTTSAPLLPNFEHVNGMSVMISPTTDEIGSLYFPVGGRSN